MRRPPPITHFLKYPTTAGTALLAIGVTLAWWSGVDMTALFEDGQIRRGQLWRLVTSALPHVNVFHLAFNLYWLWVFGSLIESTFGAAKSLLLTLFLAAGSGAAEWALLNGGVGLSGVGYGLFGFTTVLWWRRDSRYVDSIDANTIGLFVGWFFLCIFLTVSKVMPVGNIAHAVGALLGALAGLAVSGASHFRSRASVITAALIFIASSLGATLWRGHVNFSRDASFEAQLGYDSLMRNENVKAVDWLRDGTRIEPGNSYCWYTLGLAYERLGRRSEAADAFQHAHDLYPKNDDYRAGIERTRLVSTRQG